MHKLTRFLLRNFLMLLLPPLNPMKVLSLVPLGGACVMSMINLEFITFSNPLVRNSIICASLYTHGVLIGVGDDPPTPKKPYPFIILYDPWMLYAFSSRRFLTSILSILPCTAIILALYCSIFIKTSKASALEPVRVRSPEIIIRSESSIR